MDGENNGKPYDQMDDFGGTPIFGKHLNTIQTRATNINEPSNHWTPSGHETIDTWRFFQAKIFASPKTGRLQDVPSPWCLFTWLHRKKVMRDELLSVKNASICSKPKLKNDEIIYWIHTSLLLSSWRSVGDQDGVFYNMSNLHLFSTYISHTKGLAELILLMAISRTFFTQKCSSLFITHLPQAETNCNFSKGP